MIKISKARGLTCFATYHRKKKVTQTVLSKPQQLKLTTTAILPQLDSKSTEF